MTRAKLDLREPASVATSETPEPRRDRVGKRVIAGHFSAETSRKLRRLGVDTDKSVQRLLEEALDDLFAKYRV